MGNRTSLMVGVLGLWCVGCNCAPIEEDDAGEPIVEEPDAGPSARDAGPTGDCSTASICGQRVTCGNTMGCLCLGTPEGERRCGQLPVTCHAQLCDTSADCAHLGAGYFCDTPNSGCCSDPPQDQKRCVAPCGTDTSQIWPENLGIIVEGLRTFTEGGRTSLGGDGSGDLTTRVDGGTQTTVLRGPHGVNMLTMVSTGDTQLDSQGDLNEDGRVDLLFEEAAAGARWHLQSLTDADFDGTMDRRLIRTIDAATLTLEETVDRWLDGGWVLDSTRSGPTEEHQGPSTCRGMTGFPSDTSGRSFHPLGPRVPNIRILYNGPNDPTPGYCSFEKAVALSQALRTAVADIKCLKNINPFLAACVQTALAKGKLDIACGNSCTNDDAASDVGGTWRRNGPALRTNFNPAKVGDVGSVALEQTMLHELLHFCGQTHFPDSGGGGGTDTIYSCGRHCAKCSAGSPIGPFGPADQARDCARCADSTNKTKCGTQTQLVQSCQLNYAVCHGGIGENALCQSCLLSERHACDGSELRQPNRVFVCCKDCPTEAPRNTEKACNSGQGPGVQVPCGKPPSCP